MAITSGFFNSVGDDRLYNAEDMSHYFDGLITNGVFESIGDKLQVTPGEDFTVNVGTGRAMIDCHWLKNDAVYNLPIAAADVQFKRVDAIVVKLDMYARQMTLEVVQGEYSNSYIVPALTNSESTKYLVLAYIRVADGLTEIRQGHIVDMRPNTEKCGYVTGLIKQVDTSQLFAQYQDACETFYASMETYFAEKQAEFDRWFSGIVGTLGVNTELRKYQQVYTFTSPGSHVTMNIPEYEKGDIVLAHVNGMMLTEKEVIDENFTSSDFVIISNEQWTRLQFSRFYQTGDVITIIVIKSVIGDGVNSNIPVDAAMVADVSKSGLTVDAEFEEVQE